MMKVVIEIECPFCGKVHVVEVREDEFAKWQAGELIQNAMPNLSATQREQLISRLCPDCQEEIFGEDEDEGDDILACELESLGGNWW